MEERNPENWSNLSLYKKYWLIFNWISDNFITEAKKLSDKCFKIAEKYDTEHLTRFMFQDFKKGLGWIIWFERQESVTDLVNILSSNPEYKPTMVQNKLWIYEKAILYIEYKKFLDEIE